MLKKKGKILGFFVIIISSLLLLSGCLEGIGSDSDIEDIISQGASIEGQLLDYNQDYAASGLVILENENGEEVERQYAEASWENDANAEEDTIAGGGFEFANLEDGEYELSIHKLGYKIKTRTVSVNNEEPQVLDPIILEPETDFENTTIANTTSYIVFDSLAEDLNKSLITEALNLAFDTEHIVNEIYSSENHTIPNRILPPAVKGDNQDDLINYDLERAKTIIAENDIQNNLTFYYYNDSDVPENFLNLIDYLENQWKQLDGITVEFKPFANNDNYNPDEDNFKKGGWILDNPDPLFNLKEIANHTGASESVKSKLEEAKLKLDNETEAMELIYEAEKTMIDNGHLIVLYHYLTQSSQ